MEISDNAAWSRTARVYGSSMGPSPARTQDNLRPGGDSPSSAALETSLQQLLAMNACLRDALRRQKQVSAQLRLLVENPSPSMPAVADASHGVRFEPVMVAATPFAGRSERDRENASTRAATLTARQREIMDLVLVGHPNKNIAADLRVSQRTVENHRAAVMKKMGASTLVDLVRVGLAIEGRGVK